MISIENKVFVGDVDKFRVVAGVNPMGVSGTNAGWAVNNCDGIEIEYKGVGSARIPRTVLSNFNGRHIDVVELVRMCIIESEYTQFETVE